MFQKVQRFAHDHPQLTLLAALVLSSLLAMGLYFARIARTHVNPYNFFPWDLFLAWLPMLVAVGAYNLYHRQRSQGGSPTGSRLGSRRRWLIVLGLAAVWLLFMPNAPYLVTEFVNLRRGFFGGQGVPRFDGQQQFSGVPPITVPGWYDILMFVAFGWNGVFLGIASLFLMQEIVREIRGKVAGWLFALIALGLTSFGIYLGRFVRLNSWDVIAHPIQLLREIAGSALDPETYMFTAVFAVFIISTYLMFMAVRNFGQEAQVNKTG